MQLSPFLMNVCSLRNYISSTTLVSRLLAFVLLLGAGLEYCRIPQSITLQGRDLLYRDFQNRRGRRLPRHAD